MTQDKETGVSPIGRVAVVIPVYNHEGKVRDVVKEALKLNFPLFVVDDGSTDRSFDRIRDIPDVRVIHHDKNRGKGAALLTGFAAASMCADWALTIDADGQHHPEDAWNLIRAVPSCLRPIVIGCRKGMGDPHVPWTSRFGRTFSNFWVWASGGPFIEDSQSGFRLYPLPEAMCLKAQARRFQFEVEVLARAKWCGISILSAPVRVTYQPAGERVSHYRGFVDFMRNTGTFSRLIFRRICVMPFIKGR